LIQNLEAEKIPHTAPVKHVKQKLRKLSSSKTSFK
jgi:hypothetical protein